MKHLFRFFSALLLLSALPLTSSATHIVGTQLTYQAIPGLPGYYLVALKLYRDCGGIPTNSSYPIKVTSPCGNKPDLTVVFNQVTDVSEACAGTATECNPGGSTNLEPGVEEYIFTGIIDMGQTLTCTDWTFSFGDCCRSANIINLQNSGNSGFYTEAVIKTGSQSMLISNSSPLSVPTRKYVCKNDSLTLNFGANDLDADSLVYSLIPALDGTTSPPASLTYEPAFSATQPFGTGATSSFNTQTGELKVVPNLAGSVVVAVKIDEYRSINGIITKVGTSQQDIQIQVVNCAASPIQAGNTLIINNGTTTAGGSEVIATLPFQTLQVSIPATSQGTGVQLAMTLDNSQFPGVIFTTSGSGNQIMGNFVWTPDPSDVRAQPYYFPYTVTDNACPYPNVRTRILRVLVTNSLLSATPQITSSQLLLPTMLQKGETLALPDALLGSRLQVFDQIGKLVFEQNSYQNTFRANQLAAGTYLYQVTPAGEKEPISAKLMIGQ